jgi:protein SCO1/2
MSTPRTLALVLVLAPLVGCRDEPAQAPASVPAQAETPAAPALEVRELAGPEELAGGAPAPTAPISITLPDVTLTNQRGEPVRLHALVEGKIAVIQTIFTSCGSICPPMGAKFGRLQELVADQPDVALISISTDPVTDIPERLQAWGAQFDAGERWTLLTGSTRDVTTTLKALRTYTPDKQDHSSFVVIGHHGAGKWTRVDGLSDPATLVDAVQQIRGAITTSSTGAPAPVPANEVAHAYFTDVELVDQHGKSHRLYSDLLRGKVVIIHSFFTSCEGVCPPMVQRIAGLTELLRGRMGKDLLVLSLSVDPVVDTPAKLADYARKHEAGEGWLFLTGQPKDVELALFKLGFAVEVREAHSNLIVVGNEATGLWKKAFGLAEPEQLLEVVESVLDDRGEPTHDHAG